MGFEGVIESLINSVQEKPGKCKSVCRLVIVMRALRGEVRKTSERTQFSLRSRMRWAIGYSIYVEWVRGRVADGVFVEGLGVYRSAR